VDALLAAAKSKFFNNGTIWEPACEPPGQSCDPDQTTFKGFLAQYLALVARLVPYTATEIYPLLESSALAAGNHCNVGTSGQMCSMLWTTKPDDTTPVMGPQMSALNVFLANMMTFSNSKVTTQKTGGTSEGNPGAGTSTSTSNSIGGAV
jgi:mannan endo-1,6-alpha-mannosidase